MSKFMNRNFLKGVGFVLGCIFFAMIVFGLTAGCSSQQVTPRGQTTSICAIGLPAVAWIMHTDQDAEQIGSDTNIVTQANSQSFNGEVTPPAK